MAGTHRRTLRGQLIEGDNKRLIVDDGRLNHGYKVVSFHIAADITESSNDAFATLSLAYDSDLAWDWSDNRQIGWAGTYMPGTSGVNAPYSLIDPDHIVVMDLYIQGRVGAGGGTSPINYLIELETVDLTDDQTIITLIKERSQDDIR